MKVTVSWQILEEEPDFRYCGIIGTIVETLQETYLIDFGKKKLEVKKKYVQTIRGERIEYS